VKLLGYEEHDFRANLFETIIPDIETSGRDMNIYPRFTSQLNRTRKPRVKTCVETAASLGCLVESSHLQ